MCFSSPRGSIFRIAPFRISPVSRGFVVFVGLGAYAFIAGFNARRHTVDLEKKLRLTLIMRNMELESQATRDPLTHLFNRRHFFDRLERELQNARGFQRPLSILMIDVNGMNDINSTARPPRRRSRHCRRSESFFLIKRERAILPARIGGDEFAVILPDTTEQATQSAINQTAGRAWKRRRSSRPTTWTSR